MFYAMVLVSYKKYFGHSVIQDTKREKGWYISSPKDVTVSFTLESDDQVLP